MTNTSGPVLPAFSTMSAQPLGQLGAGITDADQVEDLVGVSPGHGVPGDTGDSQERVLAVGLQIGFGEHPPARCVKNNGGATTAACGSSGSPISSGRPPVPATYSRICRSETGSLR